MVAWNAPKIAHVIINLVNTNDIAEFTACDDCSGAACSAPMSFHFVPTVKHFTRHLNLLCSNTLRTPPALAAPQKPLPTRVHHLACIVNSKLRLSQPSLYKPSVSQTREASSRHKESHFSLLLLFSFSQLCSPKMKIKDFVIAVRASRQTAHQLTLNFGR